MIRQILSIHILSNEKVSLILELLVGALLYFHFLRPCKSHLWMAGWREHILGLGFLG